MYEVSEHILKAVGDKMLQGDSFRIRHAKQKNGVVCTTEQDDPALVVTRVSNGWVYQCHRCKCSGLVPDKTISPTMTRARMDALKQIPEYQKSVNIELPHDLIKMREQKAGTGVPWEAFHWLWRYSIGAEDIQKYEVGWSPSYNRVIIPIYEYAEMGDAIAKKLVGWIGRDVQQLTKKERKEKRIPKYLTRAKKGKRRYFMTVGDTDKVVICEDIVSAIKINIATKYTTIALLNTSVGNDLMRWLRGRKVWLWLDGDMVAHSVRVVERMRQLGINAKRIYTVKDPKDYNTLYISDMVKGGGV